MALSTMTLPSQMDCSDCIWQENPDPQLLKQLTWEAKPQLHSNLPRTNTTWFKTASFSGFFFFLFRVCVSLFLFLPWLLTQVKPSKANYAPQTNHVRCPLLTSPPPASSNHSTTEAFHFFFPYAFPLPALPLSLGPMQVMVAAIGSSE